ncbi:MAG: phage terminase large subunit [Alphaproteobacteria bacterium]|nr:phage terminase large subunit [Alphaproteobacteria bacterium]
MTIHVEPPSLYIPTQAETDAVLRIDFLAFLHKSFETLNPGTAFKPNWHHEAIAHALMEVMDGRCRLLNINVPPRSLKSITVSVAFVAYLLGRRPSMRVICVSYAQSLADKHSRDCRAIMESEWYRRIFPNARLSKERNSESHFMTIARGERIATSVGGTITGLGADIIIMDDTLKPQDANSEHARRAVREFYTGTLLSRLNDKRHGAIINVAQRLHPDDLTGYLLDSGGWVNLSLPAIAVNEEHIALIGGGRHDRLPGEVLHAEREPLALLEGNRKSFGSRIFEAQYQQNPLPEDGEIIHWAWFRTYRDSDFAGGATCEVVQSWDTATSNKELADWSACTTWFVIGDVYYLMDVLRVRQTYPDLKRTIVQYAQRHGCRTVLIENKGSGQSLLQEFEREGPIYPIPITPQGDKVMRLTAQTAAIEAGRVRIPQSASWLTEFKAEILRFPYGAHDDQVDSLSQFLRYAEDRRFPSIMRRSF